MSRLLDALAAGRCARGAWLFMGSPDTAEVLGHLAFDALIIDHEHSPGGVETAVHQMRAIRAAGGATILARPGRLDEHDIKVLLDCGAEGLMLPTVESAAQAREFVAACRYPPQGRRGAHFTVSRAAAWGERADEYHRDAGSRLLLVAMIESLRGVDAIPEIARVDGIGMLFIGPLDLSGSAGRMGEWVHPDVRSVLRRSHEAALATGKAVGTALVPGEVANDHFAQGVSFVTVGSDVGMLRRGAQACLS